MTGLGQEKLTTLKASRQPTSIDLAWAAGYLEGEGCFTRTNTSDHVTVTSCDIEPLQKLQQLFGGNINDYRPPRKSNHRGSWRWSIYGARARGIAMTLYIMLAPRRQIAIRRMLGAT